MVIAAGGPCNFGVRGLVEWDNLRRWVSLRTVYDIRSTAIGILTVFGTSPLIADQNSEARMYGLFLAITSLLILQFQLNNRTEAHGRGLLASNACISSIPNCSPLRMCTRTVLICMALLKRARHARPCAGHQRLRHRNEDVDGRAKPGHDEVLSIRPCSPCRGPPRFLSSLRGRAAARLLPRARRCSGSGCAPVKSERVPGGSETQRFAGPRSMPSCP